MGVLEIVDPTVKADAQLDANLIVDLPVQEIVIIIAI